MAILQVAGRRSEFDGYRNDSTQLSERAYQCILKLARTIADLTGSADAHLVEALAYRPKLMIGQANDNVAGLASFVNCVSRDPGK